MKSKLLILLLVATVIYGCSERIDSIPPFIDEPGGSEHPGSGEKPDPLPDPEPNPEEDMVYIFKEEFNGEISKKNWVHCDWNTPAWQDFMGEFSFPEPKSPEKVIPVQKENILLQAVDPVKFGSETPKNHPWCMGLWTKGKFGFKYGDIRVRAKMKMGQGAWPAIWLMPVDEESVEWPAGGEIDIMEWWNEDEEIYHSVHFNSASGATYLTKAVFAGDAGFNVDDYNEFGLRKTKGKLEFMVNGNVTFTVTKAEVESEGGVWPFEDRDYYIIINMACSPLIDHWNIGAYRKPLPSMDNLPYEMAVDYVRVAAIQ